MFVVLAGIATSYNVFAGLVANKATLAVETDGVTLGYRSFSNTNLISAFVATVA